MTAASANEKLARYLPFVRSPRSGSAVRLAGDALVAAGDANERYPFVGSSAMLLDPLEPERMTSSPPEARSGDAPGFRPPERFGPGDLVLHVRYDAIAAPAENTLSLGLLPHPTVDVVVDLERLPFADACADYVCASGILERVRHPLRAIAEIKRVLRPGGELYVDVAFMQSFHGSPAHYFNFTPLALEAYVGGAFEIVASGVSPDSSPLVAIESLLGRFASYLGASERRAFEAWTIGDLLAGLAREHGLDHPLLRDASEYAQRAMGAGSFVLARKPASYDPGMEAHPDLCRYYEARMALLLRAHEIDLYRRFAADLDAVPDGMPPAAPPAETLCAAAPERATLDGFRAATRALRAAEADAIAVRDRYLRAYLEALERSRPDAAPPAATAGIERPVIFENEVLRVRTGRYGPIAFGRRDDTIGRALDLYGEWAQAECDLLGTYVARGDIVLDVGANVGAHTLFFATAVGERGRVLAFEPQPDVFAILAANVALGGLQNVELHRAGVGATAGWVTPQRSAAAPENSGAATLNAAEAGDYWRRAPLVTIDSLELPACNLIKIDVEGMEIDALRGATDTVARHRPVIYAENTDPGRSFAVCAWLFEHRYRIFWYAAPAYNPANFAAQAQNIFGNASELGILCLPAERGLTAPPGLAESFVPSDFAPAYEARPA